MAHKCITGLLKLSMKRDNYNDLNTYLTKQIFLLRNNIQQILETEDVPTAEAYQDVFIDYCMLNMDSIIQEENTEALAVLLKLMSVGTKSYEQLLEDRYDDRVRARYQYEFWRDFLIKLQKLDSQGLKLQKL